MQMKNISIVVVTLLVSSILFASCTKDNPPVPYLLQQDDISVNAAGNGFTVQCNQLLRVIVTSVSDEGLTYQWLLDDEPISQTKNLEYMFEEGGVYDLTLIVNQSKREFRYDFKVNVKLGEIPLQPEGATAYITKVLDYMPAVGQFTNKLPLYETGDTQERMNQKVLAAIGNNNRQMITLGGFGGYVVVGFDHTIVNVEGKRDFRVLGNAFYADANPNPNAIQGGSCEPGVIMVAYDANGNGVADDHEWYEIAGSAHEDPTKELWYALAVANKNDVKTHSDYEIIYHKPKSEPAKEDWATYIQWEDNKGNSGYRTKNQYHRQSYYPLWAKGDKLTFKGTRLPQNGIDESGTGSYFVLYKFRYGYADNELNAKDDAAIDISWAVNSKGQRVHLPGIDFIKIYTGVNQENGWIGECSTEITGVEDLHALGVDIDTRE